MYIVAFGHRAGTGKDTCARFLCSQFRLKHKGKSAIHKSFAWKLKDISYQLFGWCGIQSPEYYDTHPEDKDDVLELLGMTVREVWISVGNKMRDVYPGVWLDYLLQGINTDLLVISDLRYENEATAVKIRGGFCIRIDRPDIPKSNDIADNALKDYDKWNGTITSHTGQLERLYKDVASTCSKLLGIEL